MANLFLELYTKGSLVWIPSPDEIWQSAVIIKDFDKSSLTLRVQECDTDQAKEIKLKKLDELPPLKNPDILIGSNDLTSLSYLHEPAVLHNLRVRFLEQNAIYTWCGIVLVAVNPFKDLDIYEDRTIQTYHKNMGNSLLDPHIYAVAEDSYSKLERDNRDQSIIVSGESGAGKTVSAKLAMRYFAAIAGSTTSNIEQRVLASNPIMEAIGNAKTTRNDNSSRFGKYIQILFDGHSRFITGGSMRTYLLEKSRVTCQSEGERNFHIFYQMCSYASKRESLAYLKLGEDFDFDYLGGITPSEHDDLSKFTDALNTLGFSDKQQSLIFHVIAAILHGGNIEFKKINDEKCTISKSDQHFQNFCQLLSLENSTTSQWLTHRLLKSGARDTITTPLSIQSSLYARDALLKYLYEQLFAWIVSLVNKALGPTTSDSKSMSSTRQFIGVLDIYGFEHFESNSFEQFCINYANEVLQQQFNLHVFKLEQEEYVREGIDWKMISFTDNKPVIDMIESKPIGILNLLDEECKMPKGSDYTWCDKLYHQLTIGDVFQKPKFQSNQSFIIQHFAEKVTYTVIGFLEKNRDTVWEEQTDLLRRSPIISSIFTDEDSHGEMKSKGSRMKISATPTQSKNTKASKSTVGSQFRDSLAALMKTLNSTEPHYVRCIKPNDDKAAFNFNPIRAVQQLRACGVLETVKISSNGFPSRWTYADFANRYRVLLVGTTALRQLFQIDSINTEKNRKLVRAGSNVTAEYTRKVCELVVQVVYKENFYSNFLLPHEATGTLKRTEQTLYQFGKTKIFFRAGQVALLERIRSQRLKKCAELIQKLVRGWLARRRYVKIRTMTIGLQARIRGLLGRRYYIHLKQNSAATKIQAIWRGYCQRRKYTAIKKSTLLLQKYGKGLLARRIFRSARMNSAAITIQRYWRGYRDRKKYRATLRKIIIVQNLWRRRVAKKLVKQLRVEARSVQHIQQLNKGLERKIIELQTRIEVLNGELKHAKQAAVADSLRTNIESMQTELKAAKIEITERDNILQDQAVEIANLKRSYEELEKNFEKAERRADKYRKINENLSRQIENISASQLDAKELDRQLADREKSLKASFESERKELRMQIEQERANHQGLLRRYMELENSIQNQDTESDDKPDISSVSFMMRCSELEQEIARIKQENNDLRDMLAAESGDGAAKLADHCRSLQVELDRVREERSQLKTIVLSQERSLGGNRSGPEEEVVSAFKNLLKRSEADLERLNEREQQLVDEINLMKNKEDQRVSDDSNIPINSSDFISKLKQKNFDLEKMVETLSNENGRLKRDLMTSGVLNNYDNREANGFNYDKSGNANGSAVNDFFGMFEYRQHNENLILKLIVTDFEPEIGSKLPAHLPAYLLFMCVRYTDYIDDGAQVKSLLDGTILAIKRAIKRHSFAVDYLVLWLSNVNMFITLMKQYSGDEMFGIFPESLRAFDLSEYRQIFNDMSVYLYQSLIKQAEETLQSLVVPAVLEYEGLASSGIYNQRSGSTSDPDSLPSPTEKPVDALIKELNALHQCLILHVVDAEVVQQIFKQLFYFICASALNNLLLRKDLCHWNKAIQIRFNLSSMEQWIREQQMPKWNEVVDKLDPIIQATKLLQTRKNEDNIPTIVEMCNKLNCAQIIKILNLYTAGDEEQISPTFTKKIATYLCEHPRDIDHSPSLLLDTKYQFAVSMPYHPSDVKLQTVNLPPVLVRKGLATVLKKV